MAAIVPAEEVRISEAKVDIVRPLVGLEDAVRAFNEYQKLKQKLAGPGDFIRFKDRDGNIKEAPTKTWRSKLTRFFGISVEIVKEEVETLPDGSFVVKVTAKATAPNGLYMYGDGSCWSKTKEGRGDLYHNTRSHAVTRAKNRAVLELVGFGEVSAEEISEDERVNGHTVESMQVEPAKPKARETANVSQKEVQMRKKLFALVDRLGLTKDDMRAIMKERYGKESSRELTTKEVADLIDYLESSPSFTEIEVPAEVIEASQPATTENPKEEV